MPAADGGVKSAYADLVFYEKDNEAFREKNAESNGGRLWNKVKPLLNTAAGRFGRPFLFFADTAPPF